MTPLVSVSGLAAGYDGRPAIEGVTFEVEPGASVAVIGPNGGGKTTLFRALLGQLEPLAGTARVEGRIAYVAQTDRTRLDFPVTALDVAMMGSLAGSRWWRPAARDIRTAAREALDRVGLADEAGVQFGSLSGGQRQRVLLARALVQDAAVALLDEPLAEVDPASADRITALFGELQADRLAVLVSTHDIEMARRFDFVLCLNGRQIAYGPPAETLNRQVLEATYGHELIVLDGEGTPVRAVAVQHHEH
jgi:manganese/iron transport system ATP-binding protein/manganese/zinc/iron transport system ATP- binding protein